MTFLPFRAKEPQHAQALINALAVFFFLLLLLALGKNQKQTPYPNEN